MLLERGRARWAAAGIILGDWIPFLITLPNVYPLNMLTLTRLSYETQLLYLKMYAILSLPLFIVMQIIHFKIERRLIWPVGAKDISNVGRALSAVLMFWPLVDWIALTGI